MSRLLKYRITAGLFSLLILTPVSCAAAAAQSPVKSITVEPSDVHIYANYGKQLHVTAIEANGTDKDVTTNSTYRSSDDKVATVNSRGFIEGMDAGHADITIFYTQGNVTRNSTVPVIIELFGGTETFSGIS